MFAWQATVQDEAGNIVPLPVVTVYLNNGTTLASIFSESGSPLPNPITGTMEGFVQFWARAGSYKLVGASGALETQTWSVTLGVIEKDFDSLAAIIASSDPLPVGSLLFARREGLAYQVVASGGQYTGAAYQFSEAGSKFTTRARAAASVARGGYAQGYVLSVAGARYSVNSIGPDGLVAIDMDWSGRSDAEIARMQQGDAVRVACYGDSTTDGNGTTGWTANPVDGSGNAIGSAAHNPPYAWPAVLRGVIRTMQRNTTIQIWNAGYGGRDIVTGWARNNFAAAVINNPAYGTPDICIINFGLNDVARPAFNVSSFKTELRYLLSLMDYYGVTPVLMTPDPVSAAGFRNPANVQKVVELYKDACDQYGIKLVNNHDAITDVFSGNSRNNLWKYNQPDEIHFNDVGHRVKGSHAAACFFQNTLWLDGGRGVVSIAPWAKESNTDNQTYFVFDQSEPGMNGKFGGTITITAGSYSVGSALMDVWVWSRGSTYEAFYHSMDGDNYYYPRTRANCPTIGISQYTAGSVNSIPSQASGGTQATPVYRPSEAPQNLGAIMGGLTRLTFNAPKDHNTSTVFLGFFSLRETAFPVSYANWINQSSGAAVADPDPFDTKPTIIGGGYGRMSFSFIDMVVPDGSGFCIASGRVFGSVDAATLVRRRGIAIFRNGVGLELRDVGFDNSGLIFNNFLIGGLYTWSETSNVFMVTIRVNGSGQNVVQVSSHAAPFAPIVTLTRDITQPSLLFSGSPGALIKDYTVSPNGGIARMTILDVDYTNT